MSPVVGIEASSILKQRTGIGHYTFNLLWHLRELNSPHTFRIFTNSLKDFLQDPLFDKYPHFSHVHSRIPGKVLLESWRRLRFPPIESFVGKVDLFHSTNNNPVPQRRGIRVLTVYDLFFMHHPELTDRYGGQYFHSILPRYINEWDHIVTITDAMKEEISANMNVSGDRITVIPCGLDPFYLLPFEEEKAFIEELPENIILAVGTLEGRKNYPRLLEAFRLFLDQSENSFSLVIAGIGGGATGEVIETIDRLNLNSRVKLLGYLTLNQLKICYHKAHLFAMVSLYEGFGIPVLEAMACNTPVVASNTTSFPEVIADAGFLVNPLSPEDICAAFEDIINNREKQDDLVKKGRKNISRFTWRATAELTLALYDKLLKDQD